MLSLLEDLKNLLSQKVIEDAREMVKYNEYGVGFEIVCTQLFEYDIKISSEIYEKLEALGKSMKLKEETWNYLRALIK